MTWLLPSIFHHLQPYTVHRNLLSQRTFVESPFSVWNILSLPSPWVAPIFTSRFSSNVTSSINFPIHSLAPLPIWVRHLLSCLNLWEYTYCNTQILYYTHMLTVLTLSLDYELLGVSLLSTQCPAQASLSWTFIKSPKRGQRPASVKT